MGTGHTINVQQCVNTKKTFSSKQSSVSFPIFVIFLFRKYLMYLPMIGGPLELHETKVKTTHKETLVKYFEGGKDC